LGRWENGISARLLPVAAFVLLLFVTRSSGGTLLASPVAFKRMQRQEDNELKKPRLFISFFSFDYKI
jgi:hypothetical protein